MTTKKVSRRAGVRSGASATTGSTAARARVTRNTKSERRTPKPKTAYELLERVCDHILDEPRRYYQEAWVIRNKAQIANAMGSVPPCGTMACRAGWIVALNDGLNSKALRGSQASPPRAGSRANAILDLDSSDTGDLFDAGAICAIGRTPPKHGTVAYARLGVKGLRAFMREHKSHLKARLLKDVPELGA